uniref:Rho-GAP domain-containing protein n=1 Tax=Ditylenchus dipsaci TaxID=166011 RepID=A0A915E1A1_9BILA
MHRTNKSKTLRQYAYWENTEGPSHDTHFRRTSLRNTTSRFPQQSSRPEPEQQSSSSNSSTQAQSKAQFQNHNDNHYTNFCNDLRSNLTQDTSSISQPPSYNNNHHWKAHQPNGGSQTIELPRHRFPSSSSCRSRNTKMRNPEIPLLEGSPRSSSTVTPVFGARNQSSPFSHLKDFKSYSPTSSMSSLGGQSAELLSAATTQDSMATLSTADRESISSTSKQWFHRQEAEKQAIAMCKLVMEYMGDRKSKTMTDQIALSIVECCSSRDSIRKGWELLGIFLSLVGTPTSTDVHEKLLKFVESNGDPILDSPEVTPHNMPNTARYNIFYPSKFGTELAELMELQATQYPHLRIPWIEATLIRLVFESGGDKTEGLFRIASDPEQLQTALIQLEIGVPPKVKDPHVAAALLKQWLRQLPTPIVPPPFYNRCLLAAGHPDECCQLINSLPEINRLVLTQIIILLQKLCKDEETVRLTKMDVANLSMVMAPNILRCESKDPAVIFANSRKEMEFIKTVLTHYDTMDLEVLF